MTEETEKTEITGALERAAERYVTPWWSAGVCATCEHPECVEHRASAALLRSLAARITDYRKIALRVHGHRPTLLRMAERALLAFVRGGETPNNPEHMTDG